ncbi:MAG: SpoIIE family protein phosphatase [Spirochaetaceae bacterium]|nr:SpoIIE family protein phosphatase [Spirochaetaceae bacterium]
MHGAEVGSLSAQGRLGLLVEASAHLAGTLDLRAVARVLAHSVVPELADRVEVDLIEGLFHPDLSADAVSTVMCRVARADGARSDDPPAEDEWIAYPPGGAAAVALSTGQTQADDGGPGDRWALYVPLSARGRVLGVACLRRSVGGQRLGPADRSLAEAIASRGALALDNVRLYDEARATSVALQRSLLPTAHPRVTGVTTANRYLPGSREVGVGGDWFDVIPLSCGRVAFVIGDVMGRGLRAAAAMGQLRTAVRMLAVLDHLPEDVLRHLDDLAQGTDEVQLATCVYAVFDPVERSLSFATAGHPPPVLRTPDGATTLLPQPSGAPLGVGGVAFESVTIDIVDGSRLLLYTDGLVESRDTDIDDGLATLSLAFEDGSHDLEWLCDHLLVATGRDDGHNDDIALLVAEVSGLHRDRVATWTFRGGVESVAGARVWVRKHLEAWQLVPLVELGELLVTELVTNALRHASGPIELTALLLDEIVTLAVRDGGTPLPRPRKVSESDEGGRGLHLVSVLAARWGARPTAKGKVVWCDLPLPRP